MTEPLTWIEQQLGVNVTDRQRQTACAQFSELYRKHTERQKDLEVQAAACGMTVEAYWQAVSAACWQASEGRPHADVVERVNARLRGNRIPPAWISKARLR